MNTIEAIRKRRSIRKFRQIPVERDKLTELVAAARLAAQGSNMQPLKYCVVDSPEQVAEINKVTKWAAAIAPAGDPAPDEYPTAYIVLLADTTVKKAGFDVDAGSAGATILLAATELGLGSCWLGNIGRERIAQVIGMPEHFTIHTIIALGYPAEDPVSEDAKDSVKYYKDASGRLHVPKRTLEEIAFYNKV
jgi:nitroreductase